MNPAIQSQLQVTNNARLVWNALNGVFVLYKPPSHILTMKSTLIDRLCKDLNAMEVRPPTKYVSIKGATNEKMIVQNHVNYADHPLVVGERYQPEDIKLESANFLAPDTSGVLVCGINDGVKTTRRIHKSKPTSFYKIKGILGQATDNFFKTGKIVEKSTYKHVKRPIIDKLCSAMQSAHQRKMFEFCGLDIQSQAAYELACKGPIRPADPNIPMIYTIKCVDFQPPEFTLEVVCINEYEMYLKTIIHDLGMQLHSNATCTQIQCIQYGIFNVSLALLKKHWDLECILDNMRKCKKLVDDNRFLFRYGSATLVESNSS